MSFVENYWICNPNNNINPFCEDKGNGAADPMKNEYNSKEECERVSKLCRKHTPRPTPRPIFERCEDCNIDDCANEQCDPSSPFMCVSGPASGGCAADPNFWPNRPEDCNKCCDTRSCSSNLHQNLHQNLHRIAVDYVT